MRVDFSAWHVRHGFAARRFSYSKLSGNARDFDLEVHFDIQAGLSVVTTVSFLFSDLELTSQQALTAVLRPLNGVGKHYQVDMIGGPAARGVAMTAIGSESNLNALSAFREGKDLELELRASDGELLAKLPLPNNLEFRSVYSEASQGIEPVDIFSLIEQRPQGLLSRVKNFFR
ncbi:MAG: hypothetical protein AB7K35_06030 [Pseudorhodoplanes sp.]